MSRAAPALFSSAATTTFRDSSTVVTRSALGSCTGKPNFSGCIIYSRTLPFFNSPIIVWPLTEIGELKKGKVLEYMMHPENFTVLQLPDHRLAAHRDFVQAFQAVDGHR